MSFDKPTIEVRDVYQMTYYCMMGGNILECWERKRSKRDTRKDMSSYEWVATMENVPEGAIRLWNSRKAIVSVRDYKEMRLKVKKKVKTMLGHK